MDLNENLQQLAEFIQDNTKATGVYIGKLVYQTKAIADDANENDHIDESLPKVIQFTHATRSAASMLDVQLTPEDAPISHSVFESVPPEPKYAEDGTLIEENETDILKLVQHVYIPEVVREPRMWFKTVPRLGAFMAIPIVYNSCLSDEALDAAVADYIKVTAENQSLRQQQ